MYQGPGEGNVSWFPVRQLVLAGLILKCRPETIIEIGFNMGHSCKLVMDTLLEIKDPDCQNQIKIYVFDICAHDYTEPNFEILKEEYEKFGFELVLIKGSSLDTLSNFLKNIDHVDFSNIDGLHTPEGVTSDFNNLKDKTSKDGIIFIDDYNSPVLPEKELSSTIDTLDWSQFYTSWVPGVKWGIKK